MTQEIRSRLDRLETVAETTLLAIQQLAIQQRQLQSDLSASISDVVEMISSVAEQAEVDRQAIREMQGEVRGLQVENHRILEELAAMRRGNNEP